MPLCHLNFTRINYFHLIKKNTDKLEPQEIHQIQIETKKRLIITQKEYHRNHFVFKRKNVSFLYILIGICQSNFEWKN